MNLPSQKPEHLILSGVTATSTPEMQPRISVREKAPSSDAGKKARHPSTCPYTDPSKWSISHGSTVCVVQKNLQKGKKIQMLQKRTEKYLPKGTLNPGKMNEQAPPGFM